MENQNEFYYIAIDKNGEPYIEHGLLKNVGKKAHKYIMKIGEGAKARYFYTKEEVDAYYRKEKDKTKAAAKNIGNSIKSTGDKIKNEFNKLKNSSETNKNNNSDTAAKNVVESARSRPWNNIAEVRKEKAEKARNSITEVRDLAENQKYHDFVYRKYDNNGDIEYEEVLDTKAHPEIDAIVNEMDQLRIDYAAGRINYDEVLERTQKLEKELKSTMDKDLPDHSDKNRNLNIYGYVHHK